MRHEVAQPLCLRVDATCAPTSTRPDASPSSTAVPDPNRQRAAHRAIGAAVVAGGLALSVSIHPLPNGPRLIDVFIPDRQSSSEVTKVISSSFMGAMRLDFSALELPDLVKWVQFGEQHPDITTSDLIGLVKQYGMHNVVQSFALLASLGPVRFRSWNVPYGGGSAFSPTEANGDPWRALVILLEFLEQFPVNDPGLPAVLAKVVAALGPSFVVSYVPPAAVPEAQPALLSAMADMTIAGPPSPAPTPFASVPAGAEDPTPDVLFVATPADLPAPAPVDLPIIETIEAPVPTATATATATATPTAEEPPPTYDPTPSSSGHTAAATEPSNDPQPAPEPPKPDSPSSPSGGSADGSSAGSGAGSSDSSGAGSSDSSGGGASSGGSTGSE